jgi:hypothetical protein
MDIFQVVVYEVIGLLSARVGFHASGLVKYRSVLPGMWDDAAGLIQVLAMRFC